MTGFGPRGQSQKTELQIGRTGCANTLGQKKTALAVIEDARAKTELLCCGDGFYSGTLMIVVNRFCY